MDICLIGDLDPDPSGNIGGPQFVTYHLATSLSDFYPVTVIVESSGEKFRYDDINVIPVDTSIEWLSGGLGGTFLRTMIFSSRVNELLKEISPDVVNSHRMLFTDFLSGNVPVIMSFHGAVTDSNHKLTNNIIGKLSDTVWQKMGQRAAKYATETTAVSNQLSHRLRRSYNVNSLVIYNGLPMPELRTNPQEEIGEDIVQVGYISDVKNQLFTLKNTPSEYQNLLRFVGPIQDKNYYDKLINSFGPEIESQFIGQIEKNQLKEEYERSRVCVIPSKAETFSLVALEAMGRGIPVLVNSDTVGISEIINDGENGFLFRTEYEYRKKLKKIMNDDSLWHMMSRSALKTATNMTWDRIAKQYLNVYNQYTGK